VYYELLQYQFPPGNQFSLVNDQHEDLYLHRCRYTLSNEQADTIKVKLDRALMNQGWEYLELHDLYVCSKMLLIKYDGK
jgi:uncharacterized protein YjiK